MNGRYLPITYASSPQSPQLVVRQSSTASEHDKYLSELLAERQKLSPFMTVLPNCSRLLNQEIVRVTALVGSTSFLDHDGLDHSTLMGTPLGANAMMAAGMAPPPPDLTSWNPMQSETSVSGQQQPFGIAGGSTMQTLAPAMWAAQPATGPLVKKTRRVEVPTDKHPNYNFVGRILGPRGNSLKRVEAQTGCRVMIRGKGSIKDVAKEEKMRDKAGFEHLNEALHVIVEAELPSNIIDQQINQACEIIESLLQPEDTFDAVKREQLRELAILNGTLREDGSGGPAPRGSSPFTNPGMKRAKTRR